MLFPIREPLLGCNLNVAEGKVLPSNVGYFEKWYRQLPIHKMILEGKESEIHYLALNNLQPDFPFVYLDWNVDCEISEDNYEDKKYDRNQKVKWDTDRYDHLEEDTKDDYPEWKT
jgi:hypothetical protein